MQNNNFEKISIPSGILSVKIKDKTGKLIEEKTLGKNLIVNNAKLIMAHLIGQDTTATGSTNLNGIQAFNPTLSNGTGGLAGGINVTADDLNGKTADNFRPVYFGFGAGTDVTDVTNAGLANLIAKNGVAANTTGAGVSSASDCFYGGPSGQTNPAVIEYLTSTEGIDHATVKISVTMPTTEGQPNGGSMTYTEFGLFSDFFISDNSSVPGPWPIMFARKTFAGITKTQDVSLVFVWVIRF